jgi:hypothetical protein
MADAREVTAVLLLTLAVAARAAGPCEEGRDQTGLALAPAPAGGLAVAAVDPDSAGAGGGLTVGDALAQVNATVVRTCAEYGRAVRDARHEHKALLLLVRRGGSDVALALGAATWERVVTRVPPPAPAEPRSVRTLVAGPPPPPLPPETGVTLEEVTAGIAALGGADRPSAQLVAYRKDLIRVRRQVETLEVRRSVPSGVIEGLRTVLGYYEAAGVAWASAEEERERERQPRHIAVRDSAPAPYFEDSQEAAAIDEFPFLRATVVREPRPGLVESAGAWRPWQARALLWQHGREELGRLTTWLASGSR